MDPDRMPANLFAKNPETIVAALTSKEAFPHGAASGLRVLTFYMSQAGRGMSAAQRRNLEKAKAMLSVRVEQETTDARDKWRRKVA